MVGRRVLISMDSRILCCHILSSRAITLTLSIYDGMFRVSHSCSRSLLFEVSSSSPGCGQFHQHTAQGILDTGFHRRCDTFCDQVSCLWDGPGWSAGCWRACGKPRLHLFIKLWPVFQMYLWYRVSPRWCGPGPLWCYERCRTCSWVGGSWSPTPCSHWSWVRTWHAWPQRLSALVWGPCSLLCLWVFILQTSCVGDGG